MKVHTFGASETHRVRQVLKARLLTCGSRRGALLFDFDGVLSSKTEDWIYRLPEDRSEAEALGRIASAWRMDLSGYDVPYQRHILYQAAAAELGLEIDQGPAYLAALDGVDLGAKIFVLSARSGWHATQRMRDFLATSRITPVELYQVGRVSKDRQVALLLGTLPDHHVFLFEDAEEQILQIREALGDSSDGRLEVFLIQHEASDVDTDELRQSAWSVLRRGASPRETGAATAESRWDVLKRGLEHGRSMFVYHAGQRVASLNFYVSALTFLVAGIVAVATGMSSQWKRPVGIVLSASLGIITLCLWALDWRNRMLVDVDEELLKVVEGEIASRTMIRPFEIIKATDKSPGLIRYSKILGVTFSLFLLLSVLGIVYFACHSEDP